MKGWGFHNGKDSRALQRFFGEQGAVNLCACP